MSDVATRIRKYTAKFTVAGLTRDLTARETSMQANYAAAITSMAANDMAVKQVCDGAGVPTIQYPFYLAFGRELWKKARQGISGESLAIEAALLIAKWAARGMSIPILQAIRSDVFSVQAPIAP
jgi:hypothetical protein